MDLNTQSDSILKVICDLRELYSEDPFDGWIQDKTHAQIEVISGNIDAVS